MTPSINPDETAKHTLTLMKSVYTALKASAFKQGLEPNEVIVNLIEDHVIAADTLEASAKKRVLLKRSLISRVVEAARELSEHAPFSPSITLDAIQACTADKKWAADYREYVQDDIYKHGNSLKGPINREFGFRVRLAIGGEVQKDDQGNTLNVKVAGEIIQSYTPMRAYGAGAGAGA